MKSAIALILVASSAAIAAHAAESDPTSATPLSDSQRIESLVRQNQLLVEEIQRLRINLERPKTREEAFASCMQATTGQTNPMAAESIGEHCDLLLKR
jgi:hypothetical protein